MSKAIHVTIVIIGSVALIAISLFICWAIATSDMPTWLKFFLLR